MITTRKVVPNDLESIRRIQVSFWRDVDRQAYSSQASSAPVVGFAEALANAFRHGNRRERRRFTRASCFMRSASGR